jgi:hypothetical protein
MKSKRVVTSAAVVIVCCLALAPAAQAGFYYESVTNDQAQGKRGDHQMKIKGWVDGDSSRVEFASGENEGFFADGNYLVTTDGGENVYLVNPKDETYGRFSMEELMSSLGETMKAMEQAGMGGMMKMEITDVSSEKLLEEPGGVILGRDTTHFRYKSRYTINMAVMGMKQTSTNEVIQDLWTTDELEARGFGVWLRPDRGMKTGNEGVDELLNQELGKITGFPLKLTTEMKTTNKKGKVQNSSSSMMVTLLREESVDATLFTWPDHYTEVQIVPDMKNLGAAAEEDGKKKKKKKKKGLGSLLKGGG